MVEYKAKNGQTYRYNAQTNKVEYLTTDGWFATDPNMPGVPIYTTEGFFEPGTGGFPAAPTPETPKYAHQGPTQGFTFGNLDNAQDEFYNRLDNRGVAWQKLTDWANPNGSNSNYGGWLQSQMNDEYNRYAMADAEDGVAKQTKWIEYLEKLAPGLRNQFNSMSARQRGENPALYDSGVYLG